LNKLEITPPSNSNHLRYGTDQYPAALLWVFAKNERADLTINQTTALAKMAASIILDLGG
jgi:hypothetical protein